MPKIQIEITKEVYEKLKKQAQDDDRSLTKYLVRGLTYLSNIPGGYHLLNQNPTNPANQNPNPNMVDLSTLPPNTIIKTKTPPPPKTPEEIEAEQIKSFQKLAKEIVGHEIDRIKDATLDPGDNYYDLAEEKPGFISRWPFTLPKDKQIEYLKEWKYYEDEGLLVY